MSMPRFPFAAALATAAFLVLGAPLASSTQLASPRSAQGGIPPEPKSCTKKIVSKACTSCSEPGVLDTDCKSGNDFKECSGSYTTCQNGAQCGAKIGRAHV